MKYELRGNEIKQTTESSGVIQNSGQYEIELSSNADFTDSFVLKEKAEITFNKKLYVRIRDSISPLAVANVVTFVSLGSGAGSSESDSADDMLDSIFGGGSDTVPDDAVSSDEDFNDYMDSIFGGL